MANKYKIGYYYEWKTVKYLRKLGFDAWRTPASHSPIDIIAIHPKTKKILLIQIKATSKEDFNFNSLSRDERGKLLELVERYKDFENVSIELWIFFRKFKKRKIINLKKELLKN